MHEPNPQRRVEATTVALCSLLSLGAAQSPAAPTPPTPTPTAGPRSPAAEPTPWPVVLGQRTAALERAVPIVDQVVLVPDGRTYLAEIAKWGPEGRWPVLIEDDFHAPRFVRAFEPARVIRRASVGAMPEARADREKLIASSAAAAISPGAVDIVAAAAARGIAPSMVVLARADDPAWTAAAALAAGRHAPIHFVDGSFGAPNDTLDAKTVAALRLELERAAERTALPWKGLGDAIDAFVLCHDFGWKCVPDLPAQLRIEIPSGPFPTGPGQPISTLDYLGRHADGVWWSIGSGIFGSETRAAYVAMSALFAPRRSVWLTNAYDAGPGWVAYDAPPAQRAFEKQGFRSQSWTREQNSLDGWRRILMGGFDCDALIANSHGVSTQFGLYGGGTARVEDVPIFDRPSVVHFLHSFSLQSPADPQTIGGRFLANGAYAYHGSVYEPLLQAFVTPEMLAERTGFLVPFAVAARVYEGGFARPWRTATFGDPLTLLAPPERIGLQRVAPPADGVATLRDEAVAALKRFRDERDDAAIVPAVRALALVGDDARTLQAWALAKDLAVAGEAAPHALGAIFRARDLEAFTAAFAAGGAKAPAARDMLWHLAQPRLASLSDARLASVLAAHPRGPDQSVDLEAIRTAAVRLMGREAWGRTVSEVAREAASDSVRARIMSLR
ncbi:MAG: hypothetical protein GC172_06325 [Phycisphaera sp.]|nr:hypothetical protein [Phycisphaera sp.]